MLPSIQTMEALSFHVFSKDESHWIVPHVVRSWLEMKPQSRPRDMELVQLEATWTN